MTTVSLNSSTQPEVYPAAVSQKPAVANTASTSANATSVPDDQVQLSPAALREIAMAGRIAINSGAGNLTSDQASQLASQLASIQKQSAADRQADGGTLSASDAQAIQQSQNQLSASIYSDAHNGAAPPSNAHAGEAGVREAFEAGRIVLNEKAGNLTGSQAKQLGSQLGLIQRQIAQYQQSGSASPTEGSDINQMETQLSQQIYDQAHGGNQSA